MIPQYIIQHLIIAENHKSIKSFCEKLYLNMYYIFMKYPFFYIGIYVKLF